MHLSGDRSFKNRKLVLRQSSQKALQKDEGFPKAGIQVKMVGVGGLPEPGGIMGYAGCQLFRAVAEVTVKIFDHFLQSAYLMKKMGALRQ